MKTKLSAILIFLLIASAAMPVYYIYRSAHLENKYIESLSVKISALKPLADKLNSEQSPDSEKLKKLFNEIIAREKSIAALALTDRMERLRFMIKNDSLLGSGRIVDELLKDIRDRKIPRTEEKAPLIKNYSGTDWLTEKLFIYRLSSGGQSTIAVFAFTIDRMAKLRLALELLLLLSGFSIVTAGIIILMRKTGLLQDSEEYRIKTIVIGEKSPKTEKSPDPSAKIIKPSAQKIKRDTDSGGTSSASQIDENELSLIPDNGLSQVETRPEEKIRAGEINSGIINKQVLSLFKKIHRQMSPESISLYIKTTESRLTKSYELKGKSVIRIDSLIYDSIPVSEAEKISKPGTYVTASGDRVRVPLISDGTVAGLIDIEPGKNSSAVNISIEQSEIAEMAREINKYIISNNLITDAESGFYSSRYFTGRTIECIREASEEGREFTLLMINIFDGVDADRKQKDMILKIIHPELKKAAGIKNPLFLHKDCVCLILNSPERECAIIEAALVKEISKFRLKVSDDLILKMNPRSIMRYSADSRDLNNILHEVEALAAVNN